jgi:small subunit ribosomal protein S6
MAKKERRHLYEGMYILSATLSEEARKKALDKITSSITGKKGDIDRVFEQGRKKMAYEINGRREGYYYIIYFTAPSSIVADLWKEYHLNEDLIRFVTMRAESVPENMEFKPLVIEKA